MRYVQWTSRALTALLILGVATACGETPDEAPAEFDETEMPFDVTTAGQVEGMVMYEGEPPPPEPLDMSSEPDCEAHWDETPTRDVVKVSDGRLGDVFVYVKEGLEGMEFPTTGQAVVMDQVGCRYTPMVIAAMTQQTVTFRNSDGLLHNVNATPSNNRPFNLSQPVNMDTDRTFTEPEVMIPVRCDVHGWMSGYVGIVAHPYHVVTGEGGGFDLNDLPPGDYVIEAWHSQLGTQEQTVTVQTGETAQVSFTFSEDMLGTAVVPLGDPIYPHRVEQADPESGHGAHDHAPGARALISAPDLR